MSGEPRSGEATPAPSRETLPRSARLLRSADFVRVQRGGRRIGLRHLVVVWRPNDGPNARFGLAVSRKVGNAVVRNRVKRWLREAVRRRREGLPPVDVVLIARSSAADAGAAGLAAEVEQALARLGSAS